MTTKKHILLEDRKVINELEVSDNLGFMNWHEAVEACKNLGKRWRLPTIDELNMLYENKSVVGGFANYYYWSSTEYDYNYAWVHLFDYGSQNYGYKSSSYYVRAVRAC